MGEVIGTDIDESMLSAAKRFLTDEGLRNVGLAIDDLFATELEPDSFDLVHARAVICPWVRRRPGEVLTARPAASC